MEIQYNITEADYVKSVKLSAMATQKQLNWLVAGGLGLLLLAVFGPNSLKVMGYSGVICGVLGYLIVLHLFSPMQAKRNYRNYKSIHLPLYFDVVDGGFTIRTENGQNNVKWEDVLKWREDKNYVLIYFAPKMFYMIPKRIAESGFDMEGFRKVLRDKLGGPI